MSQNKKAEAKETAQAVAQTSAPKPPRKLIPRTAPTAAVPAEEALAEPIVAPAVTPGEASTVEAAMAPGVKPLAKRSRKAEVKPAATKVRGKKSVSEAQAKAMAVKIAQPLGHPLPAAEVPKAKKPAKAKKIKLVRDSYAMPDNEYEVIGSLKKRLAILGKEFKKSELLRGGIAALAALNDAELLAVMGRLHKIKTGRPAK